MEDLLFAILLELRAMNEPRRRLLHAFLSGVMRGIGLLIGFAVLGTALIWALQPIVRANLPGISEFLAEVVTLVRLRMQ